MTPKAIQGLIQEEEAKRTISGPAKRLFNRIIQALQDYSEVIGQLASAQPLPLAIVWGALKIVVQGAARCQRMFETMRDELDILVHHITRITDHEQAYGHSPEMQNLFFTSYTNIIQFWHRVHKECTRPKIKTATSSLSSSSSDKLKAAISAIKKDAELLDRAASDYHNGIIRKEQEEAHKEREAAVTERTLQSDWRKKQSAHNYLDICSNIGQNLANLLLEETNSKRHESNLQQIHPETCGWLREDNTYSLWASCDLQDQALLCLNAPPGYGKSMLTSFAIDHLAQADKTVAFYFCQFSEQCDREVDLLRLFAKQLFDVYFKRKLPVDEDLGHQVLSGCKSSRDLQAIIRHLVTDLAPAYFFVDGIDEVEEAGRAPLSRVLTFLLDLGKELPGTIRLWCSKRAHVRSSEWFEAIVRSRKPTFFNIADHTEADVIRFLRSKFQALRTRLDEDLEGGLSVEDTRRLAVAMKYTEMRAKGNFLWAKLITQCFDGERAVSDALQLWERVILDDQPEELKNVYEKIFGQINVDDRRVASKVIGLVAFSRRHLRFAEIREIVTLIITRGKKNANDGGISRLRLPAFRQRFTTLIEFDSSGTDSVDSQNEGDRTCRLIHSSVLEYLLYNPHVLGEDPSVHITPQTIADACLLYLSRPIYSKLLQQQRQDDNKVVWLDSSGQKMDNHHFVRYAAKNWARHLEDVVPNDQIKKRAGNFISSPNFQTCMQVQMLWVDGKFNLYSVDGRVSLLRVMPMWMIYSREEDGKRFKATNHWTDYRQLIHDWQGFLSCGRCYKVDPDCVYLPSRGEIDKIWWNSLSPTNIFSKLHGRYHTFNLENESDYAAFGNGERFDALGIKKNGSFVTLRLHSPKRIGQNLDFICEHWTWNHSATVVKQTKQQIIATTRSAVEWDLYTKKSPRENSVNLVAQPVMFSDDATLLRIGAIIFFIDESNDYQPISPMVRRGAGIPPGYFEEVAGRDGLVAIGSRAYSIAEQLQYDYGLAEGPGKATKRMEALVRGHGEDSDDDDEWDSDSEASDDQADDEAYESWSEASTENGSDLDSDFDEEEEDEEEASDAASSVDEEEEAVEAVESPDSSDVEENNDENSDAETDSSGSSTPVFMLELEDQDSDDEEMEAGIKIGQLFAAIAGRSRKPRSSRKRNASAPQKMQLTVVSTASATSSPSAPRSFRYSHPLHLMLYASPPVIHPFKPLVVWPLGAGDVLFADVSTNTYFTRKLRSSAPNTRQLSVKLQFSPCGSYLHVATIEAQAVSPETNGLTLPKLAKLPIFRLSILLLTYRLSSRKTTRSPPSLVHRVKIHLGSWVNLHVSRLPFTMAWSPTHLFISLSEDQLRVYRIALFRDSNPQGDNVHVRKEAVFLPDTASEREVHYLPSPDDRDQNLILIGSESRKRKNITLQNVDSSLDFVTQANAEMDGVTSDFAPASNRILSPPIGCVLGEKDLGDWIRLQDIPVPKGQHAGKLDQRRERFDPVDDCDVVPYFR